MSAPIDPEKLDKLADIAITVGLGLKPGQDLYMTSPLGALPLARRIATAAYKAGASLVTTIFSDEEMTLARYRYGSDASFERAAVAGRSRIRSSRSASQKITFGSLSFSAYSTSSATHQAFMPTAATPIETAAQ